MNDERDPGAPATLAPSGELLPGQARGDRLNSFAGPGIVVSWSRARCIHAAACVFGLPRVFAPGHRPWVDPSQGSADDIARVVKHCPTGALHYTRDDGGALEVAPEVNTVAVTRNGPLHLAGAIEVFDEGGQLVLTDTRAALCRCGRSSNPPLCDGTHMVLGFRDDGGLGREPAADVPVATHGELRVRPERAGPLHLEGPFRLRSADHRILVSCDSAKLCRCGGSKNKPFCDGTHLERAALQR